MSNPIQQQRQEFNNGGIGPNMPASNQNPQLFGENNNVPPGNAGTESFTSFVNSQMLYDNQALVDNYHRSDPCGADSAEVKVLCLLSFIGCCDSNRMAFGPYCLMHNKLLFHRTFVTTTNDGGVTPLVSVALSPVKAHRSMMLLSTMPGNPTEADLASVFEPLAKMVDGAMFNNVLKFFLLLTTPENRWNSDAYLNDFKRYMADVSAGYYQFVSKYAHIIERTQLSVGVSPDHFLRIRNNSWWQKIFGLVNTRQVAVVNGNGSEDTGPVEERNQQGTMFYLIPLSMFNLIDILTVLSFNFDIRFGDIGYQYNVDVYNGAFFIGTGYGINNAVQASNKTPNFNNYPPNIAKIIRENYGVPQHNLDFLILNVVPVINNDTVTHSLAVAERRLDKVAICLEKITRKNTGTTGIGGGVRV